MQALQDLHVNRLIFLELFEGFCSCACLFNQPWCDFLQYSLYLIHNVIYNIYWQWKVNGENHSTRTFKTPNRNDDICIYIGVKNKKCNKGLTACHYSQEIHMPSQPTPVIYSFIDKYNAGTSYPDNDECVKWMIGLVDAWSTWLMVLAWERSGWCCGRVRMNACSLGVVLFTP